MLAHHWQDYLIERWEQLSPILLDQTTMRWRCFPAPMLSLFHNIHPFASKKITSSPRWDATRYSLHGNCSVKIANNLTLQTASNAWEQLIASHQKAWLQRFAKAFENECSTQIMQTPLANKDEPIQGDDFENSVTPRSPLIPQSPLFVGVDTRTKQHYPTFSFYDGVSSRTKFS
jgi:hypothetical protein